MHAQGRSLLPRFSISGFLTRRRKGDGDEIAKRKLAGCDYQHTGQEVDAEALKKPAPFERKPEGEQHGGWCQQNPKAPKEHRLAKSVPPRKGPHQHELSRKKQHESCPESKCHRHNKQLANDRSGRTCGVQCKLHILFKLNRHGLAKASISAPGIWPNSLERTN